ncbi:MAG: helix-turn-helix transcriptional regulator [Actinomycetota bacterium]|jgi:hypothetical protein|nr:helix-turn-helix transcriptional regulator [Actinomycetota bacterium]
MTMKSGATLRTARVAAGLSRRQLARRARTSQARISSYKSGTLTSEPQTKHRPLQAMRPLPSVVLDRYREEVKRLAASHHLLCVRVFGSIAPGGPTRSQATSTCLSPPTKRRHCSTRLLSCFMLDVETLTGYEIDVVSNAPLTDDARIVVEARWL